MPGSNRIDAIVPSGTRTPGMHPIKVKYALCSGLLAAIIGITSVPRIMASPMWPELAEPSGQEHHVGKVIFVELVTPDLAAAKKFYAELFGWTFRDTQAHGTNYAEASVGGRIVAGLIQRNLPAGEYRQPSWLGFIAVRDVEAVKKIALQHGAKVLLEPHKVPSLGWEAVFADPQGGAFAALASSRGDPPDVLAVPGQWIWSS